MLIPKQQIYKYKAAGKPFLSIVTRHHVGRPKAMGRNRESVKKIEGNDYEHIMLIDDGPRGLEFANCQFNEHRLLPAGRYIWKLDDDDMIIYPALLKELKTIVNEHKPDLIMVKARIDKHEFPIMPTPKVWGKKPVVAEVCCLNYIVRAPVWRKHIKACCGKAGCAWRFLSALWKEVEKDKLSVYWWDKIIASTQTGLGAGKGE